MVTSSCVDNPGTTCVEPTLPIYYRTCIVTHLVTVLVLRPVGKFDQSH